MALADDVFYMQLALREANQAQKVGEVPVGAVLVASGGRVIGAAYNNVVGLSDPSAHAEVLALRKAGENLRNYRLPNTTLYVTLEPCTMCLGALVHSRVERLVLATNEPKAGRVNSFPMLSEPCFNHRIEVTSGVCQQQASDMLRAFFKARRTRR